jgi:hypothetical protein
MKNDINYYMSEVEVPPEVEEIFSRYTQQEALHLVRQLGTSLEDLNSGYSEKLAYTRISKSRDLPEDQWLSQQSRDTWVRVLRWISMEVI